MNIRAVSGYTQKQIATALDVTEHTIRNWEKGRSVPTLTIQQFKILCRLLNCDPFDLPESLKVDESQPASDSDHIIGREVSASTR